MTFDENERMQAVRNVLTCLKEKLDSDNEQALFQIVFSEKANMKAYKFMITSDTELSGKTYDKFVEIKHYAADMLNWSFNLEYVDLGIFEEKNSFEAEIALKV